MYEGDDEALSVYEAVFRARVTDSAVVDGVYRHGFVEQVLSPETGQYMTPESARYGTPTLGWLRLPSGEEIPADTIVWAAFAGLVNGAPVYDAVGVQAAASGGGATLVMGVVAPSGGVSLSNVSYTTICTASLAAGTYLFAVLVPIQWPAGLAAEAVTLRLRNTTASVDIYTHYLEEKAVTTSSGRLLSFSIVATLTVPVNVALQGIWGSAGPGSSSGITADVSSRLSWMGQP